MAKIVNGSNVLIKFGEVGSEEIIACSTSCTVNINMEAKDVVCKNATTDADMEWKQFTPGMKRWDMTVDGLYVINPDGANEIGWPDIVDKIIDAEQVTVVFDAIDTELTVWQHTMTGTGYITSTSLTAGAKEDATFSLSFTGNGKLDSVAQEKA